MKRINYLLIVLLIKSTLLYSQEVYLKTSTNYNFAVSKQQMPEYFTIQINPPVSNIIVPDINLNVNEFSVASGLNFQGTVGFSFNDFLSFELKFSTFNNSKKEFEASPKSNYAINGKTVWDLRYYSLLPTFLFGQSFNKSTVNVFVYSGLGISKLNIKVLVDKLYCEYEFDRSNTFTWGYGLEYSYSISKNFSLYTNIGINNTKYKPNKAQLVSSSSSLEYLTTSQKEIKYVDEITNLELGYNGSAGPNSAEIRLKETLKLNSIYWGVGIKYTLKK